VYYENNPIGTFQLPARIPIIGDSGKSITLRAGIQRNGLSYNRAPYPFYNFEIQPINWKAGSAYTFNPQFKYSPTNQMEMYLHEDFESGNAFGKVNNNDTNIIQSNGAKYGTKCGHLILDTLHTKSEVMIDNPVSIPANTNCWIELDYKSDMNFAINVQCIAGNLTTKVVSLIGINKKADWNKIYIDIGALATVERFSKYNVIIAAYKPEGQKEGNVWIDNFKIIGPR
jgi:hypothetical protein